MGWTQRQARPAEPPTSRSEALASCTSHRGIGSIAASLLLRESSLATLGRVLGQAHDLLAPPRKPVRIRRRCLVRWFDDSISYAKLFAVGTLNTERPPAQIRTCGFV
jgi:hypothetical protein